MVPHHQFFWKCSRLFNNLSGKTVSKPKNLVEKEFGHQKDGVVDTAHVGDIVTGAFVIVNTGC